MPILFKGDGCPYVMARVGGLELEFLLDTGSSHSFINTAVFQDLERQARLLGMSLPSLQSERAGFRTATGERVPVWGGLDILPEMFSEPVHQRFVMAGVAGQGFLG